ncbi:3-oxoacyl-[acyl-carrier protein] reductase [Catalinimonas alkaloidigena]|uniref:3-oxoacyl-[acyl-carrier protein] reductase n=1 Tax=Catalinimonas alkaloidigena TaxID=1075417 RepID=A0A1G9E3N2_9BACT|nr:SDR family oxidoreductase [Catalinimonas alkaloidigena]SDK70710.1 3-oxoacyl-[acyl-carrier protein] reductase [Catalinimonas alkaloidigena]
MELKLNDKRAVVCGSTQGIGRAVAQELAALGCSVTLVARDEEKLQAVRRELPARDTQRHDYVVADFSHPDELREKMDVYLERLRHVHILVNNTGGPPGGPLTEADASTFRKAFNQHLICNQTLVQCLLPLMKESGYGRIINIISTSVKQPIPGLGVSNTIRAAVANWAKTLSQELGPFGITVNNVLPGSTDTERLRSLIEQWAERDGLTPDEMAEKMQREIPVRRFATPAEVAAAVTFLATPAAAFINGINLPVDGGRTSSL